MKTKSENRMTGSPFKRMNRSASAASRLVLLAAALALVIAVVSCGKSAPETKSAGETLYTCGMHPQVILPKPGLCPICGMKLVPIRKQPAMMAEATGGGRRKVLYYKSTMSPGETSPGPAKDSMGMDMAPVYEGAAGPAETGVISIDSATRQNMDLRTGLVTNGPVRRTVRTVGVVDFNEATLADVTTKFKGWIEKLYVDTTGQQVHRGEPLFEVYSPELYSAQTEFVLAMNEAASKGGVGAELIEKSALDKLRYFDVSNAQIAELQKTRQVKKTLQVIAPLDGIVVEKTVVAGQMVDAGQRLYRLADLGLVWVYAQIYEEELPYIRLGQEVTVTLTYLPDRKFRGRVTYLYPTVDDKTRTARVRMEFHNPGFFLKPGMFATVELSAELMPAAVLVPDLAVLRSGAKNTVFVALDGGRFAPRTVVLGPRAEHGMYQVLNGLSAGERVVISGQFLLDSESQLREAILKMQEPETRPVGEPAVATAPPAGPGAGAAATSTNEAATVWVCPMPEHVSIEYNHSGRCPLCGMTLVPVTQREIGRLQPGGKLLYYVCPMPEHSDVRSDKPGKCPKCGMTLIPVMSALEATPPATHPAPGDAMPGHQH